jgi:hypothetical protein
MRRIRAFSIVVVLFSTVLWTGAAQGQLGPDRLAPFPEFVQGLAVADLPTYQARPESRVRDAKAFEQMRQHVLSLYRGVHVSHSFVLDAQAFDCVPIAEQPSVRLLGLKAIAQAPPPSVPAAPESADPAPGKAALPAGRVDRFGNAIHCENGTIPMRRVTLEELTRFNDLHEFFQKGPDGAGRAHPAAIAPEVYVHKYAHAYQLVNNYGGNSWLNLWSPAINGGAGQIFSLSQHWYVGGSGSSLQTAEGGWQVYPGKYGTGNAVLFIYWTADGYNATGCYNLDCAAFVQTNNNWHLGAGFSSYSTPGGTQYEFQMQWKLYAGNWWLYLQGTGSYDPVGYYPGSIYRGGQLTQFATEIDYGGETVGSTSWPPMGSGAWASANWSWAAYQRLIFYTDLSYNGQWSALNPSEPSPGCYSLNYTPSSQGGSWGSYFFFGGPGGGGC